MGLAGYPTLRVMALAETGTRGLLGATVGSAADRDEATLARRLLSFHLEHPDPASLAPLLTALDADAQIRPSAAPALIAHLSGPNGSMVLH